MNILITSAGRRTTLVKIFKSAVSQYGGQVYTTDINCLAPALYFSDKAFKSPPVEEPEYLDYLLDIITKYNIKLLVPTIDTELLLLASSREILENSGCIPLISSEEFIYITGDKWLTVNAFEARGVRCPRSWIQENLKYDSVPENLFIKPRGGSASQNAYSFTITELNEYIPKVSNFIIQELLDGPEITVDALLDLDGKPIHYVPRIRLRTLGGESIQGKTIEDTEVREWMINLLNIISSMGGRGPQTLQYFMTPNGPVLTEINPRFGGGFPLGYHAGGKYPEWILQMLYGKIMSSKIGEYKANLYMTRFFDEHFTEEPLWKD